MELMKRTRKGGVPSSPDSCAARVSLICLRMRLVMPGCCIFPSTSLDCESKWQCDIFMANRLSAAPTGDHRCITTLARMLIA